MSHDTARSGVLELPGGQLAFDLAGPTSGAASGSSSGAAPAVVLVHGFGLDRRMWEPQWVPLADRRRVLRYDLRGFGPGGELDPSVPYTHAGDLLTLLDHVGIDVAVVVGLSYGGHVALQTALTAPDRVCAIVLVDALVEGVPWDRPSADAAREAARLARAEGLDAARSAWLAHPLFETAPSAPAAADLLRRMVADYPGQHWLGLDPHLPETAPLDRLAELRMPALVLSGADDVPGFVAMSDALAAGLPNVDDVRVAGAGHLVNLERPEDVTAALERFLEKLG